MEDDVPTPKDEIHEIRRRVNDGELDANAGAAEIAKIRARKIPHPTSEEK